MSRASDSFAPSWLPRQRRRHVDRALRKLIHRNVCSLCGSPFEPSTATATGFDAGGNAAVAGECCTGKLVEIFGLGLNFAPPTNPEASIIDILRRSGAMPVAPRINLTETRWTKDDEDWFERNQERSHRLRMPFPSESDKEMAETPTGYVLLMLVQQVEPDSRIRARFYLSSDLLPLPDDEATAHALFEVAVRHEPVPSERWALNALIKKYKTQESGHDA